MFDALAEFAVARGQFVGALLQFAEQPGILQRDHRLVGKGADELDLPVGKRLHPIRPRQITPTTIPSRSNGTPSEVRFFPSVTDSVSVNSGSAARSWTWTT